MLNTLKEIQYKGILHNDIKPSNICWGKFENSQLIDIDKFFLIDFGYSRYFGEFIYKNQNGNNNEKSFKHFAMKYENFFQGTSEYMSIDKSLGKSPNRRSDCEELLYVIFSLIKNLLPWKLVNSNDHVSRILEMFKIKTKILSENLLQEIPKELVSIYKMVRNLKYEEMPDYNIYNILLKNLLMNNGEIINTKDKTLLETHLINFFGDIKADTIYKNTQDKKYNIFKEYPLKK